jgi:hypothetical protein
MKSEGEYILEMFLIFQLKACRYDVHKPEIGLQAHKTRNVLTLLCEYKTWSLYLRKFHKLEIFEKIMVRTIYRLMYDDVNYSVSGIYLTLLRE